jgi:hypothetical protein
MRYFSCLAFFLALCGTAPAQTAPGRTALLQAREATRAASHAEWERQMKELGLAAIRPGANTRDPSAPNAVNYDDAKANLYPLPDPLVRKDGSRVATLAQWRTQRRPELLRLVTQELYGAVPANAPAIAWHVDAVERQTVQGVAVIVKHITGHADNSADPAITVAIKADITTPAGTASRKVPLVLAIGNLRPFVPPPGMTPPPDPTPDWRLQILRRGWGYAIYDPTSVQADNGAGLAAGIIGLANHGNPRSLGGWGVLRAWAWGASRVLDYLETDRDVDAGRVAIFGHSRYGKTALVAMAYDERFAAGFISSSGKGGAAPYRRRFGETTENIADPDAFHWMVGNYMQYAADPHTANDLDVDSDDVIALCAPRPLFIGAGASVPAPGKPDDAWVDAHGSWMALDMAGGVYVLYGKKRLDRGFPPPLTLSDSGVLAFRQHDQGHTPSPNWPYFLDFAARNFAKS